MPAHHITKRKKIALKWSLAIMLSSTMATSFAAGDSAGLTISGTVTPTACTINLTPNGVVDYGSISGYDVKKNAPFHKPQSSSPPITLKIDCSPDKKIRIKVTDNKASSVAPKAMDALHTGWDDTFGFGLDFTSDNKKIGAYSIQFKPGSFTLTNTNTNISDPQTRTLISQDGNTWNDNATGAAKNGTWISWGPTSIYSPASLTSLVGTITVETAINSNDLSLTDPILLKGSATLALEYI